MYDRWQSINKWLDTPSADSFVVNVEMNQVSIHELDEVLEGFDIPVTRQNRLRLVNLVVDWPVAA